MLQFVLEKGFVLKRIHAIVNAKQETFLKSYNELNNTKRTQCSKR